jgi:uncharacterized protein DUF4160
MPTVLRIGKLRVVIYPNDHRPAHVHVMDANHEAIFKLNCPLGPPTLMENYGFSMQKLNFVESELQKKLGLICQQWRNIHGYN